MWSDAGYLRSLGNRDSKRDRFYEELRRVTEDGRPVLIFTEYTDTMEYVRDGLVLPMARVWGSSAVTRTVVDGDGG